MLDARGDAIDDLNYKRELNQWKKKTFYKL